MKNIFLIKRVVFFIIIFICVESNLLSQKNNESFVIEGGYFPNITIENLIKWLEMPMNKWEQEMIKYDFSYKVTKPLSLEYKNNESQWDEPYLSIIKNIEKHILVIWDYGKDKGYNSIVNDIYNKLEPFYFKSKLSGAHFKLITGNKTYEINIWREFGFEMISIDYFKGVKYHSE